MISKLRIGLVTVAMLLGSMFTPVLARAEASGKLVGMVLGTQYLSNIPNNTYQGAFAFFQDTDGSVSSSNYAATVNFGDGTAPVAASILGPTSFGALNNLFAVNTSHNYAALGNYTLTVSITDTDGGSLTLLGTFAVVSGSPWPSQQLSGSVLAISTAIGVAYNGVIATFQDADGNTLVSKYEADINFGDGTAPVVGIISYNSASNTFSVSASHTYAFQGSYQVTVFLIDPSDGNAYMFPNTATIAAISGPLTGSVNNTAVDSGVAFVGVVALFQDADLNTVATNYAATINWGDGTSSSTAAGNVSISYGSGSNSFSILSSHTYNLPYFYPNGSTVNATVTVTLTDADGNSLKMTGIFSVTKVSTANSSLSGSLLNLSNIAGMGYSGVIATFQDSVVDSLSNYSATINWGDKSTSAGTITYNSGTNTFAVAGSHTYAHVGNYDLVVSIVDSDQHSLLLTGDFTIYPNGISEVKMIAAGNGIQRQP